MLDNSTCPSLSLAISLKASSGGRIFATMSHFHASPMVQPTAVYLSSVYSDSLPAPDSITTRRPALTSLAHVSGAMATRRSPLKDSFGIPTVRSAYKATDAAGASGATTARVRKLTDPEPLLLPLRNTTWPDELLDAAEVRRTAERAREKEAGEEEEDLLPARRRGCAENG